MSDRGFGPDPNLAVWFDPQSIRDHWDGCDDDPTAGLCDRMLRKVGEQALYDDRIWNAFHHALTDAVYAVREELGK